MIDDYEVDTAGAYPFTVQLTVPVEIEIPKTALELCQWHYNAAIARGNDPEFADFLYDLVEIQPQYYVDGAPVDEDSGELIEAEEDNDE